MKKLYKRFLLWLMKTALWRDLLIKVIPYIRFTLYYTSFRGRVYHKGYKKLQPGDIIVAVDKKKLTSLLIPGTWTHAALCVSKDASWEVSEMTHHNYTKSCFFDICKEADRVAILRCKDFTEEYTKRVISRCKMFEHVNYDLSFSLGVSALYCSELVYQSDLEHRLDVDLTDIHALGTEYISPDGLYGAKNINIVWDSDNG